MRGRIALRKHRVRNPSECLSRFAQLWKCVRVLAPLLRARCNTWLLTSRIVIGESSDICKPAVVTRNYIRTHGVAF
jgi:hypothetical protein